MNSVSLGALIEAVIGYLKNRFRQDPDFGEYSLSELRSAEAGLVGVDGRLLRELIGIAELMNGGENVGTDDFRFRVPPHIERIAKWSDAGDVLRHEAEVTAASRVDKKPKSKGSVREFKTTHVYHQESREHAGEGAVGIVFKVRDEDGNYFALKQLRANFVGKEEHKRFKNERHWCRNCDHPNIIRVLDWGDAEIDGVVTPFYVTKFYGTTLQKEIKKGMVASRVPSIFEQVMAGIIAAHESRVWHRDLKPANILIGDDDVTVVADFGIAHIREELQATVLGTRTGDRTGSFGYAAPEQQARPSQSNDRTDVFLLGLILNEMFTQAMPHGTGYKTIASVAPEFGGLDELVDRMLRQAPSERPSVEELPDLFRAAIGRGSRDPTAGSQPTNIAQARRTLHADSEKLARLICAQSANAWVGSESLNLVLLRKELGVEQSDFDLAVDELEERQLLVRDEVFGGAFAIQATWDLFFEMDASVKGWNLREDALSVAKELVKTRDGAESDTIAQALGWSPRRMNPACAYLERERKVDVRKPIGGTGPYVFARLSPIDATRRLARDGF